MDVLSDVLEKVRIKGAVYFQSDFAAPWGMSVSQSEFAQFHLVTRGQCVLEAGQETRRLFTGDLVIFPRGSAHELSDQEGSLKQNGKEVMNSIISGRNIYAGEPLATTLVCGHFEFDRSFDHPFIKELPGIIHISGQEKRELIWLNQIAELVIHESAKKETGSSLILKKLGEILFIHALRAFAQQNNNYGFLAALKNPQIGMALKAIHTFPREDWQLETLAREAGISRTGFSTAFKKLMQETPFEYLTRWRVLLAKDLLAHSDRPVREIASEVGYRSEAAFNRTFKRYFSRTPLKYRQYANRQ